MPTKIDNNQNIPAYTNIDADNAELSKKQTRLNDDSTEKNRENPLDNLPLVGFLVSFSGTELGEYWVLREGNKNIIGSDIDCTIRLNEAKVSSKHAFINIRRNANTGKLMIAIQDTNSMNGIMVNGIDIGFQNYECKNNDKILIGGYELLLITIDKKQHNLSKSEHFIANKAVLDVPDFDYSNRDNYSYGTRM